MLYLNFELESTMCFTGPSIDVVSQWRWTIRLRCRRRHGSYVGLGPSLVHHWTPTNIGMCWRRVCVAADQKTLRKMKYFANFRTRLCSRRLANWSLPPKTARSVRYREIFMLLPRLVSALHCWDNENFHQTDSSGQPNLLRSKMQWTLSSSTSTTRKPV